MYPRNINHNLLVTVYRRDEVGMITTHRSIIISQYMLMSIPLIIINHMTDFYETHDVVRMSYL
jgi:hypothetical protein